MNSNGGGSARLPIWVTVIVVLVLLVLLGYNIVIVGPDGIANSYILGSLLGAYGGVDAWLRHRSNGDDEDPRHRGGGPR